MCCYRKAVMAILTHPAHGNDALRFCTQKTGQAKPNITPMRLLVKHMPGLFIYVRACKLSNL